MEKLERPHWSYSQINQFLRICPMQFAFQRLFKLQPEFVSESLPFGSAIHRTRWPTCRLWTVSSGGTFCSRRKPPPSCSTQPRGRRRISIGWSI